MLRFPYKLVALTCAALLFCTGCQLRMGYPEELYGSSADGVLQSTSKPNTQTPTPQKPTPGTTTNADPNTPDDPTPPESNPPATDEPVTDAPVTEEPTVPKKRIAFTFDDGPHYKLTYQFVDKLKEYGATATFFVVGNRLGKAEGAAIAYAYENGCEIGIHSYTHDSSLYYDRCSEDDYFADMKATADAINQYVPATVTLMRPPGGNITAERVEMCPYSVITWNVDSLDWKYRDRTDDATTEANINTIVDNVMKDISEGDIVLMHEIYQNSYEAFSILIERLYADGYEIVSVTELLGDRLEPGVKYNHA